MAAENEKSGLINLIHFPVLTLGIGKRIGIWFQGCSIHCPDCIARHTWDFSEEYRIEISEVIVSVRKYAADSPEGITISGGEPFDQPEALHGLLEGCRNEGFEDIMVYSGYEFSRLQKLYKKTVSLITTLIDGRFVSGDATRSVWKGSENQKMHIITRKKGLRERYLAFRESETGKRSLQIVENSGKIFVVGIPDQKDAEVIKHGLV
ncbi:MAG: 4Fe-4S single cluster domain-containing protein [Candidatus Wallbacteria bacterium]|nr:4Fe-4S single cluster domain-containing protein [Candidatus Wallbacteria bacterium]